MLTQTNVISPHYGQSEEYRNATPVLVACCAARMRISVDMSTCSSTKIPVSTGRRDGQQPSKLKVLALPWQDTMIYLAIFGK